MRGKVLLLPAAMLLGALLLLPAGCGREEEKEEEGGFSLYFLAGTESGRGPALQAQTWAAEENVGPGELMEALLAGPQGEGLTSPFPGGVSLQQWEWDTERPGNVVVMVSEQYSGLTDISLTLADYSIVLTLSQLPEVDSVEIRSAGYSANYRSHQLLTPEEAVLSDPLDGEGLDKTGGGT